MITQEHYDKMTLDYEIKKSYIAAWLKLIYRQTMKDNCNLTLERAPSARLLIQRGLVIINADGVLELTPVGRCYCHMKLHYYGSIFDHSQRRYPPAWDSMGLYTEKEVRRWGSAFWTHYRDRRR